MRGAWPLALPTLTRCVVSGFNWTCPFCDRAQVVVGPKIGSGNHSLGVKGPDGEDLAIQWAAISCANTKCQKVTVNMAVGRDTGKEVGWQVSSDAKTTLFRGCLVPQGRHRPQPEYIPEPIRQDYYEACLIRDLSPKAAATLIRRCLQGMIRDFAGISKNRLVDEVDALNKAVDEGTADRAITPESVAAIDHVRHLGNIGAHMEKDINNIIDVSGQEAEALIGLVEMLFDEWYGARFRRNERLKSIETIRFDKAT